MKKQFIAIIFISLFIAVLISISGCSDVSEVTQKLKIINVKLTTEEYAFAIPKGSDILRRNLNDYIKTLKDTGTLDSIFSIHLDENSTLSKTGVIPFKEVENTDKNLVVATNFPFKPFEYTGRDGLLYGIDIEIAQAYANYKGLDLCVLNVEFGDILKTVASGKADLGMAGITVTNERKQICDFTDPYHISSQILIVDGKNTKFDNCKTPADVKRVIQSLPNESIGYQIGTTGNRYVTGDGTKKKQGFSNIKPAGYKTANEAISALLSGEIYACVLDEGPSHSMLAEINSAKTDK